MGTAIVKYLVAWFHHFYEEPVHQAPYNSREDGYLYIYGGPYHAEEELREEFETVVSEEAIMKAVEVIQSNGFDWAPSANHPDRIAYHEEAALEQYGPESMDFEELKHIASEDRRFNVGSDRELVARAKIVKQIEAVQDSLPKPTKHGGIGHNHPAEQFGLQGENLSVVAENLEAIDAELQKAKPVVATVAQHASYLKRTAEWVANKLVKFIDESCKEFGSTSGKTAGIALPAAILASPYWGRLVELISGLQEWLLLVLSWDGLADRRRPFI